MLLISSMNGFDYKIANYFAAIAVSLFVDGYMQCTSKPMDLIHSYQPLFILYLRIGLCLILSISIFNFALNLSHFAVVLACTLFLIIIFDQYLKIGYRTYRNSFSKTCLLVLVIVFFSVFIFILADAYS